MERESIKISDLRQVKGIGDKTIKRVKEYLLNLRSVQERKDEVAKITPPVDMNFDLDSIYCNESIEFMRSNVPNNSIDLTITSPPYDNLRNYNGYNFDYKAMLSELYRVTKDGGVVVWVVGDSTVEGSETGTSFKQALYAKSVGFNLHDTMIYMKRNPMPQVKTKRYTQSFEYMFVFTKGMPNTCNYITEATTSVGRVNETTNRLADGSIVKGVNYGKPIRDSKIIKNVWEYNVGFMHTTTDKGAYKHPAMFPEKLAEDHILSWSNEGDIVFDPMCGSGTTCKVAKLNNRKFVGIDISEEYCNIARERVSVV